MEPSVPLGNFKGIGSEYHLYDFMINAYNQGKGKDVVIGGFSFTSPVYFVVNNEFLKTVMIKDFNNFVNRGIYVNEKDDPLSGNKNLIFIAIKI